MAEHFISQEDAKADLLACATYIAETIESADGHATAISAVVKRYLEVGNVDLAAELANTVDDPFTRDRLLIHIAEKCADMDDDEYAHQLLEAIDDPALQAEGRERIGILEAGKGDIEAALRIADEMEHPEFVQAAIATRHFTSGDFDAYAAMLGSIQFPSARVAALTGIAHAMIDSDRGADAAKILERASTDAESIEHEEERIRSLIEVGTLTADAGSTEQALRSFEKAFELTEKLDNVYRDAFFAAISVGFLRSGDQERSDAALDLVEDKVQIATCLLGHAQHYWTSGSAADATDAADEAHTILRSQKDTEVRSTKERRKLMASIAAQFALFERFERAVEIAESIDDENERYAALGRVAAISASKGSDVQSRVALNSIDDDAHRAFALMGVSDAAEQNGEREAAIGHLRMSRELVDNISQLASRASAYRELARRYAAWEDDPSLDDAFQGSLATIGEMRDSSGKVAALAELSALTEELELELGPEEEEILARLVRG